jgi:hypothetical protein
LCEFTDNQSQGQTVLCVFVDIATPLTGSLSLLFALSRSSGRDTILLLCGTGTGACLFMLCFDLEDDVFVFEADLLLTSRETLVAMKMVTEMEL